MTVPANIAHLNLGKHVFSREHVAGARRDGLAYERDEVDVLRTECGPNHFDCELGIEILAGKNVDIGIAGQIAEMAGDGRGLDQLHEGISGRLWQMFGEMLEQRRPIPLHADSLDKGFDEAGNVLCALHAFPVTG
jgi:hypothetical protein